MGGASSRRGRPPLRGARPGKTTAVHLLARSGRVPELKAALTKDPATLNAGNFLGMTPLHEAVGRGFVHTAKELLSRGADPGLVTVEGHAPLHNACVAGSVHCVRALLNAGADLHQQTREGESPLHRAARFDRHAVVEVLLVRGAVSALVDDKGRTPLDLAPRGSKTARLLEADREKRAQTRQPETVRVVRRAGRRRCWGRHDEWCCGCWTFMRAKRRVGDV